MIDEVLVGMDSSFDELYAEGGCSFALHEHLLKAHLLIAICSVRQFCKRLRYDMVFRWFQGSTWGVEEESFDACGRAKSGGRLPEGKVSGGLFTQVVELAREHG